MDRVKIDIDTHRLGELCDTEGATEYPLGTLGKPTPRRKEVANYPLGNQGAHLKERSHERQEVKGHWARAWHTQCILGHVPTRAPHARSWRGCAPPPPARSRRPSRGAARGLPPATHTYGSVGRVGSEGRTPPIGLADRRVRRPLLGTAGLAGGNLNGHGWALAHLERSESA